MKNNFRITYIEIVKALQEHYSTMLNKELYQKFKDKLTLKYNNKLKYDSNAEILSIQTEDKSKNENEIKQRLKRRRRLKN
jgi:hypothetical protein